ncbi:MAG: hypothetical protein RR656_01105, partial [Cetobacterium sp.]
TKYNINQESAKNWDKTIPTVVKQESLIEDWYGAEEVLFFLRKSGKVDEKDVDFLTSLKTKDITPEDQEKFNDLLVKIVGKLDREFYLNDENIKESNLRMANPSNHIAKEVATEKEWAQIVEFSKQKDLSEKDVKKLRKLLNNFIKRDEFFNSKSWYNREISGRTLEIVEIYKKGDKTKLEKNNLNAKGLYIAYPEYFSKLEKWDD